MSARERFEAAYATNGCTWHWSGSPQSPYLVMDCGTVIPHGVEWMRWRQSWQAARAEALEEAAEVCDEAARRCKSNSMAVSSTHARDNWLSEADSHIVNADAIRALKDKEPA